MHPSLADEPAIKARNRIVSRVMFSIVDYCVRCWFKNDLWIGLGRQVACIILPRPALVLVASVRKRVDGH